MLDALDGVVISTAEPTGNPDQERYRWTEHIEFEKQEIPGDSTHRLQLIKNASAVFRHEAPADAVVIWSLVIIKSTEVAGQDRKWEYVERIDWPVDPLEERLRKLYPVVSDSPTTDDLAESDP